MYGLPHSYTQSHIFLFFYEFKHCPTQHHVSEYLDLFITGFLKQKFSSCGRSDFTLNAVFGPAKTGSNFTLLTCFWEVFGSKIDGDASCFLSSQKQIQG
jgi:hypothetical protein